MKDYFKKSILGDIRSAYSTGNPDLPRNGEDEREYVLREVEYRFEELVTERKHLYRISIGIVVFFVFGLPAIAFGFIHNEVVKVAIYGLSPLVGLGSIYPQSLLEKWFAPFNDKIQAYRELISEYSTPKR